VKDFETKMAHETNVIMVYSGACTCLATDFVVAKPPLAQKFTDAIIICFTPERQEWPHRYIRQGEIDLTVSIPIGSRTYR
jgi:hypothetical protein